MTAPTLLICYSPEENNFSLKFIVHVISLYQLVLERYSTLKFSNFSGFFIVSKLSTLYMAAIHDVIPIINKIILYNDKKLLKKIFALPRRQDIHLFCNEKQSTSKT